jgi:transposase
MLRLYIWGYMNGVCSSRRLELECARNVEVLWLLRRLAPDFKTIADFRRDNLAALAAAAAAFVSFCRAAGVLGRTASIDGTKLRAAASATKIVTQDRIDAERARIAAARTKIEAFLAAMEEADGVEEAAAGDVTGALAQLAALAARGEKLDLDAATLEASGRNSLVDGEPQARPMGRKDAQRPPSYNLQHVVDAKTHFIVHQEATDEASDNRLLERMGEAAHAALGPQEETTVLADRGYSNGAQAAALEAAGIVVAAPVAPAVNTHGLYDADRFVFDAHADAMICPAGKALGFSQTARDGARMYRARRADCAACPLKGDCTTSERRTVRRNPNADALARMQARVDADPALMRLRKATVEHTFACGKRILGGRLRLRGLAGANGEAALAALAYNLKRLIALGLQPVVLAA